MTIFDFCYWALVVGGVLYAVVAPSYVMWSRSRQSRKEVDEILTDLEEFLEEMENGGGCDLGVEDHW